MWALLLAAVVPRALAHGGLPESNGLAFATNGAYWPVVKTTFGLLRRESAQNWRWICEEVAGGAGIYSFAVLPDGTWLLGTTTGILRSEDRCDWESVAALDGLYVPTVARDTVTDGVVWATTAAGAAPNALYRSADSGKTWTEQASFGEGSSVRGFRQGRLGTPLVASGWRDELPYVWFSADGDTWTELGLDVPEGASVTLLALDDAGRAWLRVSDGRQDLVVGLSEDGALISTDPTEDSVLAFDAGPGVDTLLLSTDVDGLRLSADAGSTWTTPDDTPTPRCLASQADARYACTHNWSDGAAVMSASLSDADPSGLEWQEILWFGDVRAVEDCPAGTTTADLCDPLWDTVSAASGFNLDRAPEDTDTGVQKDHGGCGCGPAPGAPSKLLPLAAFALLFLRRRCAPAL